MISWFTSLTGAIALSFVALLSFIGYAFLVSRYVLEELTPGITAAAVETLVVIAIVGGWGWGLLAAARGSRSGLIVALAFSVLPALFTLYDLIFHSPIPYGWPLVQISVWTTFVSCVIAIAAIALQLR
ncbi:MAG: hypothetical protein WA996_21620 [Candidatus Promineifilaceae bacterium]